MLGSGETYTLLGLRFPKSFPLFSLPQLCLVEQSQIIKYQLDECHQTLLKPELEIDDTEIDDTEIK